MSSCVFTYDTDVVMRKLWLHLVRDFRTTIGQDYAVRQEDAFVTGGLKVFRGTYWPSRALVSRYIHKCDYQLENLFKRYRFKDDVFSDTELLVDARAKFLATQERVSKPILRTPLVHRVLQKARQYAKRILGQYDLDEHLSLCRFGKRACANVPYAASYLDVKFGQPVTGSRAQIEWFKNYLKSDKILSDAICSTQGGSEVAYEICEHLTYSSVPKTFKALRGVMPNTMIGSFQSYGLGKMIQARLKLAGLDITILQKRHRLLAKLNSISRWLATADLSAASDSITRELLMWILPLPWYRAVMHGLVRKCLLDGNVIKLSSIITMGMGHTFTLQTLVFYCLLKAIGELGSPRKSNFVSVYGDDLIYPSRNHRYVVHIFKKLHLILNEDKTYVKDFFRESCGGDYYRGSDVRPFQPEGGHKLLDRQAYACFLYKLINGLSARWNEVEIPSARKYLLMEIIYSQNKILQIPPFFPDTAGLKVSQPIRDPLYYEPVKYHSINGSWMFKYLLVVNDLRAVKSQYPYYWEKLRSSDANEEFDPFSSRSDEPTLRWKRTTLVPRKVFIGNYETRARNGTEPIAVYRVARLEPMTSNKTCSVQLEQQGSTACWAG